ncbi:MAG TPA: hypothetical protein VJ901_23070 [Thermoanaerobaculia bacterium]|nr:hypothetical protein [Thermoanaerobaculia bacterium]
MTLTFSRRGHAASHTAAWPPFANYSGGMAAALHFFFKFANRLFASA